MQKLAVACGVKEDLPYYKKEVGPYFSTLEENFPSIVKVGYYWSKDHFILSHTI